MKGSNTRVMPASTSPRLLRFELLQVSLLPVLLALQRRRQVREGRRVQVIFEALANGLVQVVLGARHEVGALLQPNNALVQPLRPLDRLDDVHQGDLVSRPCEREPPAAALGTAEKSAFDEPLKDL